MVNLLVKVIMDGAAQALRDMGFSEKQVKENTITPVFEELGYKLSGSMSDEFSTDLLYSGDMASGFFVRVNDDKDVEIVTYTDHDIYIRKGTKGPYKGFPSPVREWAIFKLGVPEDEATAIAFSVMKSGTSDKMSEKYPEGRRLFQYPKYIVEEKERATIERSPAVIAGLTISYALGKARRVASF